MNPQPKPDWCTTTTHRSCIYLGLNSERSITLTLGAANSPYGSGTDSYAPIIALGEGWAYFMGHYLADRRYGASSSQTFEQGFTYTNGQIFQDLAFLANTGLNAHVNLLEDFNPNRTSDPFYWIPKGLMYDLIDARNDNNAVPRRVPLDDQVSRYYTIQNLFNALQGDINKWPDYKMRLLAQNANNQAAGVNTIFAFYAY